MVLHAVSYSIPGTGTCLKYYVSYHFSSSSILLFRNNDTKNEDTTTAAQHSAASSTSNSWYYGTPQLVASLIVDDIHIPWYVCKKIGSEVNCIAANYR